MTILMENLSFGNARSDVNNKFRGKMSKILVYQTALTGR